MKLLNTRVGFVGLFTCCNCGPAFSNTVAWGLKAASATRVLVLLLLPLPLSVTAATLYVNASCTNSTPPYTNWVSAATNIQDAVDAASSGDLVLVTNGTYSTGGRVVSSYLLTNRLVVSKALTVQSMSGPAATLIQGYGVMGNSAVRCVYLTNGASLYGFTLTNGATRKSGNSINEQRGGGVWCVSASAVLSNCVLAGNAAYFEAGGALSGTLVNCTLTGNAAGTVGGGAGLATLNNCTLTGNSAYDGGGAANATLDNCTLTGNSASNAAGGAAEGTLNNCTLTGNSAGNSGGGASEATLNNCIVYFNNAGSGSANYYGGTLNYCCTTPLPASGAGNLSADPQLASASHLSAASPCRGAGSAAYATGVDIDGDPWANPPSIGCDEYWPGSVTGPLSVGISATYTNVVTAFSVDFTALIAGRVAASVWDFGDGQRVTNRPYASHSWSTPSNYTVVLTAYNETYPDGVNATLSILVQAPPVSYVALGSTNPVPPYGSWATAAPDIQSAVDAAIIPGALVLVSNGIYATGRQVTVNKPLTVSSVNGAALSVIDGEGVVGCASLSSSAVLTGFTLTNGHAAAVGGGVSCDSPADVVSNCVVVGNWASSAGGGACGGTLYNCTLTANYSSGAGGAYGATLYNCTLTSNSCSSDGGGASSCTLYNCTLTGNSAPDFGGGTSGCTLYNCIDYFNNAGAGSANYEGGTLNYCCTTPLPADGLGNIMDEPAFVDLAGGDLRLQSNSPCINAGNNAYVVGSMDLDGRPRIVGGKVDMGAYEFQPGVSGAFIGWLQYYGLPTDGSADLADSDGDGMNNWQEWVAGTDPTNAVSLLQLLPPVVVPPALLLRWSSDASHTYFVERASGLEATPAFSLLQTNVSGQDRTTTFTDTTAPSLGTAFYRVGTDSGGVSAPLWLEAPQLLPANATVVWTSVTNRSYVLERSDSLSEPMLFTPVATNLPGQTGTTSYSDTTTSGPGPFFYRVRVQ